MLLISDGKGCKIRTASPKSFHRQAKLESEIQSSCTYCDFQQLETSIEYQKLLCAAILAEKYLFIIVLPWQKSQTQ